MTPIEFREEYARLVRDIGASLGDDSHARALICVAQGLVQETHSGRAIYLLHQGWLRMDHRKHTLVLSETGQKLLDDLGASGWLLEARRAAAGAVLHNARKALVDVRDALTRALEQLPVDDPLAFEIRELHRALIGVNP